jgi:hypothetical protein
MEKEFSSTVSFWVGQIDNYEMQFQPWDKRSKKIIGRYRDDRKGKTRARFNLLWSNVQTLHPAIYDSPPKVNIDGRNKNDDDLSRYTALVLERTASYYVGRDIFDDVMKQATLDRLLPGRGTAWVRYVPTFQDVEQITDDATMQSDDVNEEPEQELYSEDTIPDYVHWQDFGHTWARTWQEVRGVWRRVYLSRAELVKRFGEDVGNKVQLDAKQRTDDGKETEAGKKACVYEIWDKTKKKAIWIQKDYPEVLDEKDDPLGLKDFFPCPKPIYATLTNDDLIPTPDYIQYQDQAQELDVLTGRIESITKAVKVAGVYASNAESIERLLSEGVENKLLPVDQWAAFAEKGGLAGVFSLMPMQEILVTLQGLYIARDKVKQDIYEITGISDIIRGASDPNETLGAQQLKGQYAGLRLGAMQRDVARFSRDLVRIMTEIIAEHFSMDTIKQVSGIDLLTEVEKQQIQMIQLQMQQQAQMQPPPQEGQPPAPPPQLPPEIKDKLELMKLPSWEQIEEVIRNDMVRCFSIDIETDSTIKQDQEAEKAARNEFLQASGSFIQQMQTVQNPELQPLLMEMLMFGVRGFKVSRELETTFDNVLDDMKKKMENPAPPQPDPAAQAEQARTQMEMQKAEASVQLEQAKLQNSQQAEQLKAQTSKEIEAGKAQIQMQIEQMKMQNQRVIEQMKLNNQANIEKMRLEYQSANEYSKAEINANTEEKKIRADLIKNDLNNRSV